VREATFSLIADWAGTAGDGAERMLAGLSFIDLYAGSGAVALEAASRGAAPVVAVESDQGTARIARGNAQALGLAITVLASTVEKALAGDPKAPFDVVWADPPYALPGERLAPVLAAAAERWVATDGLLVLERASRDAPPLWPGNVTDSWLRRYGETTLYFAMKGR
jgi:16S rRNA (guanine966-N2)-methyltransferase